jgi:hypothetical protein
VTPGGIITEFPVTGFAGSPGPTGITAGPDGNLWFTIIGEGGTVIDQIGRISPAGAITYFHLPSGSNPANSLEITTGPDGNLWFTEVSRPAIGRITPQGVVTEFPLAFGPRSITAAHDGNLWFTYPHQIGKITPAGQITLFDLPNEVPFPVHIAAAPDGHLWVIDGTSGYVGKFTPPPLAAPTLTGLQPPFGPSTGGTQVSLIGANFSFGMTVKFGAVAASSVTVIDTSHAVTLTPAHDIGFVDVAAASCDGRQTILPSAFTFDCQAPFLKVQPTASQTVRQGQNATITVDAGGSTPLSYQWYKGESGDTSSQISGATGSTFTLAVLSRSTYWVRVTNSCGHADSTSAVVDVCVPPVIEIEPSSQPVTRGTSVTLSVGTSGSDPKQFQWYKGVSGDASGPVSGATQPTFATPGVLEQSSFWVRVQNSCGSVQSSTAILTPVDAGNRKRSVRH